MNASLRPVLQQDGVPTARSGVTRGTFSAVEDEQVGPFEAFEAWPVEPIFMPIRANVCAPRPISRR